MRIIINELEKELDNNFKIKDLLEQVDDSEFLEIWIEGGNNKLCILSNTNRAFLMCMQEDQNYVSYDENETDDGEEFLLSNGQLDEYPKNMTIKKTLIKDIVSDFIKCESRTKKINWIEG